MKNTAKATPTLGTKIGFLISPEDSTPAGKHLPAWTTSGCQGCKTLLWLVVSVAASVLVGQL